MVFAAGLIRGFTGFGFSIAAVPLLSAIMPPAQAVPIVLVLQLLVSLSGLGEAVKICDWRSIRVLALGVLIATPVGLWGLERLPAPLVRLAIAAIVLIAVILLARGFRLAAAPRGAGVLPFGVVSGLFNGLAGMPGPPVIAFYLAAPIGSAVARASMIVLFLATSAIALVPLAGLGALGAATLLAAAFGFPAVWIGSRAGAALYRRSPERRYRTVAMALLVATALLAAARAVLDFA